VHEDPSYLLQLCKAGAVGYVLKRSAGDDLIHAIRTVAGGGLHFDPTLASKALTGRSGDVPNKVGLHPGDLSEREKEVLMLLAWGYSNKEIAGNLGLSTKGWRNNKSSVCGEMIPVTSEKPIVVRVCSASFCRASGVIPSFRSHRGAWYSYALHGGYEEQLYQRDSAHFLSR
jgi:hypothetical protein